MNPQSLDAVFWLKLISTIGAFAIAGYGVHGVFERLKSRQQGFGPTSVQALAAVIFIPSVIILALNAGLDAHSLSTLLGTIGGYLLAPKGSDNKD